MSEFSTSLRTLSLEAQQILDTIEEAEGELDSSLELFLDLINKNLTEKIDQYDVLMRRLEAEDTLLDERIKELTQIKKRNLAFSDRLKGNILQAMITMRTEKLSGNVAEFKVQKAGGKERLTLDESILHRSYWKEIVERVPDKDKIRAKLELGEEVAGASLSRSYVLKNKTIAGRLK